jgi:hypothetical protein
MQAQVVIYRYEIFVDDVNMVWDYDNLLKMLLLVNNWLCYFARALMMACSEQI